MYYTKFQTQLEAKDEFVLLAKKQVKTTVVKAKNKNNFFSKFRFFNKKNSDGSFSVKEFIGKLSSGLMLPIAMLPIAGLFLGIGSALYIQGTTNNIEWLKVIGSILKTPGEAVFGNLAVLFAIAIAIVFAEDSGVAGLSAFLGWLVFCAFQSSLIGSYSESFAHPDKLRYTFLWFDFDATTFNAIFGNNVGIQSLNTSVFGGIIVGFLVAKIYRKFKNTQLPQILGFFNGARFVPIVTFVSMLGVSLIFCLLWPYCGLGIYFLGNHLGKVPYGINSFIFCVIERFLVPFGLQHAFYIPLWQTAAGGSLDLNTVMMFNGHNVLVNNQTITWLAFARANGWKGASIVSGDQYIWSFMNSLSGLKVKVEGMDELQTITFDWARTSFPNGVNVTQYMEGRYPFMNFGLPAAAAAMVVAAPKNKRKLAFSAVIGAALTTFLTGITEPIEFTFLFLAPWLYYGFHAFLAGLSGLFLGLWHAHIGMTFAAGMIDFTLYGILPDILGAQAGSWKAIIVGLGLVPLYFFGFWFLIVKFNVLTPGRGESTHLFTKKDLLAKQDNNKKDALVLSKLNAKEKEAYEVLQALGGKDNIVLVNACITKLRVNVKDRKKVNEKALIALGAKGVTYPSKNSVYSIFGGKADIYKNLINDLLKKL
ncbi:MAG: PTS transporter subunit EIIC [Mycoplasma sp.]